MIWIRNTAFYTSTSFNAKEIIDKIMYKLNTHHYFHVDLSISLNKIMRACRGGFRGEGAGPSHTPEISEYLLNSTSSGKQES